MRIGPVARGCCVQVAARVSRETSVRQNTGPQRPFRGGPTARGLSKLAPGARPVAQVPGPLRGGDLGVAPLGAAGCPCGGPQSRQAGLAIGHVPAIGRRPETPGPLGGVVRRGLADGSRAGPAAKERRDLGAQLGANAITTSLSPLAARRIADVWRSAARRARPSGALDRAPTRILGRLRFYGGEACSHARQGERRPSCGEPSAVSANASRAPRTSFKSWAIPSLRSGEFWRRRNRPLKPRELRRRRPRWLQGLPSTFIPDWVGRLGGPRLLLGSNGRILQKPAAVRVAARSRCALAALAPHRLRHDLASPRLGAPEFATALEYVSRETSRSENPG